MIKFVLCCLVLTLISFEARGDESSAAPSNYHTLAGKVVRVIDGDTIIVLDAENSQHRIRLASIDAPEKTQPFGRKSKDNLSRLVFGKYVDVVWNKYDNYKRIVGKVLLAKPSCKTANDVICEKVVDVGLRQIIDGLAWWYRKYSKEQVIDDQLQYEFAETNAKTNFIGLWSSDIEPIAPWEWRKKSP